MLLVHSGSRTSICLDMPSIPVAHAYEGNGFDTLWEAQTGKVWETWTHRSP